MRIWAHLLYFLWSSGLGLSNPLPDTKRDNSFDLGLTAAINEYNLRSSEKNSQQASTLLHKRGLFNRKKGGTQNSQGSNRAGSNSPQEKQKQQLDWKAPLRSLQRAGGQARQWVSQRGRGQGQNQGVKGGLSNPRLSKSGSKGLLGGIRDRFRKTKSKKVEVKKTPMERITEATRATELEKAAIGSRLDPLGLADGDAARLLIGHGLRNRLKAQRASRSGLGKLKEYRRFSEKHAKKSKKWQKKVKQELDRIEKARETINKGIELERRLRDLTSPAAQKPDSLSADSRRSSISDDPRPGESHLKIKFPKPEIDWSFKGSGKDTVPKVGSIS